MESRTAVSNHWTGLLTGLALADPEGGWKGCNVTPPLCYVMRKLIIYTNALFQITFNDRRAL